MTKTHGVDFGQNSIGWANINDGIIIEMGSRVLSTLELKKPSLKYLLRHEFEKTKRFPRTHKLTLIICAALTILTLVNTSNWQFWLGLSFATLLTYLTLKK